MNIKNLEQSFNPRLAVPNFDSYLRTSKENAKLAEKKLTGKTESAIETTGDLVTETLLPAFFFGASIFILYKATQGKKA